MLLPRRRHEAVRWLINIVVACRMSWYANKSRRWMCSIDRNRMQSIRKSIAHKRRLAISDVRWSWVCVLSGIIIFACLRNNADTYDIADVSYDRFTCYGSYLRNYYVCVHVEYDWCTKSCESRMVHMSAGLSHSGRNVRYWSSVPKKKILTCCMHIYMSLKNSQERKKKTQSLQRKKILTVHTFVCVMANIRRPILNFVRFVQSHWITMLPVL